MTAGRQLVSRGRTGEAHHDPDRLPPHFGEQLRRRTATRSAACSSLRRRCGNTPTGSPTRRWSRRTATPSKTTTSPGRARTRFSSTSFSTTRFLDYKTNIELYPALHEYFRARQPPLLVIWGRNDPFFLPAGTESFRRDIPGTDVRLLDTGHFALETHAAEIADAIRAFLTD